MLPKVVLVHTTKNRVNHQTNEVYEDNLYYDFYIKYKKPQEEKPHISIGNNEFVFVDGNKEETYSEEI